MTLARLMALPENDRADMAKVLGMSYEVRDDGTWRLRLLTKPEREARSTVASA
jgi:hypothetical protein